MVAGVIWSIGAPIGVYTFVRISVILCMHPTIYHLNNSVLLYMHQRNPLHASYSKNRINLCMHQRYPLYASYYSPL